MFANIRSTLPHKNFDIIEKTVLAGTLDPKYIRALNTGIFYPETADVADVSLTVTSFTVCECW